MIYAAETTMLRCPENGVTCRASLLVGCFGQPFTGKMLGNHHFHPVLKILLFGVVVVR